MSKTDFGPDVAGTMKGYRPVLLASGAVALIGLGWVAMFWNEMTATDWGVFTAVWMFLTGITQFGVVFSATMRICEAEWARPYQRIAELATLAFAPIAILGFALIYFGGRDELLYWTHAGEGVHLSPWLNDKFLFWRNLLAMLLFYAVANWYFVSGLLPDVEPSMAESGPAWRRALYRRLVKRKQGRDMERVEAQLWRIPTIVPVVFILNQTFIAWDFGMMLWPHYHSTVYPMYSVVGNIFGGTALIILLGGLVAGMGDLGRYFTVERRRSLGAMATGFTLLWMYFFWSQFFVTWYGNLPNEMAPIWAKMYGHYQPLFWAMMACVFFIPLGTLIFAVVKRTFWMLGALAVIMLFGTWLNRYLMIMPSVSEDHLQFSALTEIIIGGGFVAGFVFMLLLVYQTFPLISRWEMDMKDYRPDLADRPHLW
ncbi:MAG: hypothetical protein E2O56_00465 [Gammaproteobacteria bacterium]|nr:MAG: hypothetical protein E2O56_00465 [Gammaproteobacteria bacterium]